MKYSFTERQIEIMDLIAEGKSIREIARLLHVSDDCIKQHRCKIRLEVGLKPVDSLKRWLYENGWEEPDF
jgi:DNA-binding NarL/FixJ family response regulator